MIRTALYDPSRESLTIGGEELLDAWRSDGKSIIWLDLEQVTLDDARSMLESFDLHELAIDDALKTRRPPKMEAFEDFVFLLLRGLDADTTDIDFGVLQLSFFVGERFLITYHQKRSRSVNHVFSTIEASTQDISAGPSNLVLVIANSLARRYLDILLELEPRLEELEHEVFEAPNDDHLAELTGYKNRLRDIGRIGRYHEQVVRGLQRRRRSIIDPDSFEHELNDLYEQVERTISLADLYYDMARDLTDGYLALSAHRLNRVMQVLTVITVIFVPLTFIAGIYGMNFHHMPELSSSSGYFVVLGVMFTIATVLIMIFRRKGWV